MSRPRRSSTPRLDRLVSAQIPEHDEVEHSVDLSADSSSDDEDEGGTKQKGIILAAETKPRFDKLKSSPGNSEKARIAKEQYNKDKIFIRKRLYACEALCLEELAELIGPIHYISFLTFAYWGYNKDYYWSMHQFTSDEILTALSALVSLALIEIGIFAFSCIYVKKIADIDLLKLFDFVIDKHGRYMVIVVFCWLIRLLETSFFKHMGFDMWD